MKVTECRFLVFLVFLNCFISITKRWMRMDYEVMHHVPMFPVDGRIGLRYRTCYFWCWDRDRNLLVLDW